MGMLSDLIRSYVMNTLHINAVPDSEVSKVQYKVVEYLQISYFHKQDQCQVSISEFSKGLLKAVIYNYCE
jgi:hypothetical protein